MTSSTTASGRNSRATLTAHGAVGRGADLPALVAQRHRQQVGERRLVVDDEHADGLPSGWRRGAGGVRTDVG